MLTLLLYGLLAVILAGVLFLLATRFLPAGEQIAPPLRDEAPWGLPGDRMLEPGDVDAVRLPVALRGYRFAETDILLDRLAGELRARDLEIARLRGEPLPGSDGDVIADGGTDAGTGAGPAAPAPAPQGGEPPAPLSFAKPGPSTDDPAEQPADPIPGDAPQPPPSDDDERPVTRTPPPLDDQR